ncbi:hypothetical protein BN341_140 [Helicobacter heilmannii ASB1.4]|nr:hypothetical protein BN341_140 [Helicobacter heilmannii ASB1.4]
MPTIPISKMSPIKENKLMDWCTIPRAKNAPEKLKGIVTMMIKGSKSDS